VRTAAQQLGDAAEALVASRLEAAGWKIHARNVRIGRHELDLIATDPGPPQALVFVEVRWRARRDFGLAEETVDAAKRRHLRAATFGLLGGQVPRSGPIPRLPSLPLRFDLVVVEPGGRIRHHRAAL
jgi:putative endonuclease